MGTLWIVFLVALNFGVSWYNAASVGKVWVESKTAGGWPRVLAWCGAVMSASGFTYCLLALVGGLAYFVSVRAGHPMPPKYVNGFCSLGYLVIIFPILGSGLGITINSWASFWRQRTFGGGAIAAWNTYAQISNTVEALSAVPEAIKAVAEMFSGGGSSSSDDEDAVVWILVVVLLVAGCALGGIFLTRHILFANAQSHVREVERQYAPTGRLRMA